MTKIRAHCPCPDREPRHWPGTAPLTAKQRARSAQRSRRALGWRPPWLDFLAARPPAGQRRREAPRSCPTAAPLAHPHQAREAGAEGAKRPEGRRARSAHAHQRAFSVPFPLFLLGPTKSLIGKGLSSEKGTKRWSGEDKKVVERGTKRWLSVTIKKMSHKQRERLCRTL